ncbi:MAG: hypothetical protein Q9214_004601 [Letrouitia sp. 1 TL-2023]
MSPLCFPILIISLPLLTFAHPTPQQPGLEFMPISNHSAPNSTGIFLDVNPAYYNPNLTAAATAAAAPESRAVDSNWQYGCDIVAKNICRALDAGALSASHGSDTDFLGGLDHEVWNYKAYTGCLAGAWVPADVNGMVDEECLNGYLYPMIAALLEDEGRSNRASVNVQVFPREGSDGALVDAGRIGFILQL